ncbi:hypothetical protein ACH5RR_008401 [Cinchona calisaya]|uniref:Uncharacterized protein n=1 Tax=Cinchona calisaya TaxID=153742 RepID=A0ABD3ABH0_9GENT
MLPIIRQTSSTTCFSRKSVDGVIPNSAFYIPNSRKSVPGATFRSEDIPNVGLRTSPQACQISVCRLFFLLLWLLDTNTETQIMMDKILNDLWFKKVALKTRKPTYHQYHPWLDHELDISFNHDDGSTNSNKEGGFLLLNTFDIIAFYFSFDVTNLFCINNYHGGVVKGDKFVSVESWKRILDKM